MNQLVAVLLPLIRPDHFRWVTVRGCTKALLSRLLAGDVTHPAKWLRRWCTLLLGILSLSCPYRKGREKVTLAAQGLALWWLGHSMCSSRNQNKDRPLSLCSQRMCHSAEHVILPSEQHSLSLYPECLLQLNNLNMRCGLVSGSIRFGVEHARVWILALFFTSLLPLIPRLITCLEAALRQKTPPDSLRLKKFYLNKYILLLDIQMTQKLETFL